MKRRLFCFFIMLFSVISLNAQGIFPVFLVLDGAQTASDEGRNKVWRPDWPFQLPPDAFTLRFGEISRIKLQWYGVLAEGFPEESFNIEFRLGPCGRTELFPFLLDGNIVQAAFVYDEYDRLGKITIAFPSGEILWELETLEHRDSFPFLVRAFNGQAWFFIFISRGVNEFIETWYDERGNFLGAFGFSFARINNRQRVTAVWEFPGLDSLNLVEYFYDSWGFITEIYRTDGLYKALYYREDLPRFWERRTFGSGGSEGQGRFTLQWDGNDLLSRVTGEADNDGDFLESRFEYTLDERGNWIERREIRIRREAGLLFSSFGTIFRRVLEYRE